MVEETEKPAATAMKEETENSAPVTKTHQKSAGDDSDAEGEIAVGDSDDLKKTPPPTRHPLEHSWTFWYDSPSAKSKQSSWGNSLRNIFTFSTVEDFWSIFNNVHRPSKLLSGSDFYCFKSKIEPKWEDAICANGGKWTLTYQRTKADTSWLYTLLAMIGEQFDYGDEICGAVVNVRGKQDKISIWTKNGANEAAQLSIGKQWKEFLDYNDPIGFILHDDAKKLDRNAKNHYSI